MSVPLGCKNEVLARCFGGKSTMHLISHFIYDDHVSQLPFSCGSIKMLFFTKVCKGLLRCMNALGKIAWRVAVIIYQCSVIVSHE